MSEWMKRYTSLFHAWKSQRVTVQTGSVFSVYFNFKCFWDRINKAVCIHVVKSRCNMSNATWNMAERFSASFMSLLALSHHITVFLNPSTYSYRQTVWIQRLLMFFTASESKFCFTAFVSGFHKSLRAASKKLLSQKFVLARTEPDLQMASFYHVWG